MEKYDQMDFEGGIFFADRTYMQIKKEEGTGEEITYAKPQYGEEHVLIPFPFDNLSKKGVSSKEVARGMATLLCDFISQPGYTVVDRSYSNGGNPVIQYFVQPEDAGTRGPDFKIRALKNGIGITREILSRQPEGTLENWLKAIQKVSQK